MSCHRHFGIFIAGAVTLLSFLLVVPSAHAAKRQRQRQRQTDFDACYREAETAHEKGAYTEARQRLEEPACADFERIEAIHARLLLLLRVDIALNDHDSARTHAAELLAAGYDEVIDGDREPELASLVTEARAELLAKQTSSVSRVAEDINLVPATISVVTARQIRDRGYVDLEAVLHDVPDIDISRGSGVSYANTYMRGLWTDSSDRVLFVIDGIEQNETHTNVAYISRQFSLSNIERVEVVYGPASTLYGANAYAGVINVQTRDGSDLLRDNKIFGVRMNAGFGGGTRGMNSRLIDGQMILSDKGKHVALSIAGRGYLGREQDLSEFSTWDFQSPNPAITFKPIDYADPDREGAPINY
ncbi:MAG: TonB-dependent receptor plug domain-containing protein, partial [Myxococcales bacterium]|nr:TonB-dependent receptor plug domain-containing protein [Myxococcales bacterium]